MEKQEEFELFDFLKKLFSNRDTVTEPDTAIAPSGKAEDNQSGTRLCKTCGKPISYNPAWRNIPKYCSDCRANYKASRQSRQGMITITCKNCGKTETIPENVQHWPDLCQECRRKLPAQQITRTCKGCGKEFTFPSTVRHWPNYCRQCQAKHRKRKKK